MLVTFKAKDLKSTTGVIHADEPMTVDMSYWMDKLNIAGIYIGEERTKEFVLERISDEAQKLIEKRMPYEVYAAISMYDKNKNTIEINELSFIETINQFSDQIDLETKTRILKDFLYDKKEEIADLISLPASTIVQLSQTFDGQSIILQALGKELKLPFEQVNDGMKKAKVTKNEVAQNDCSCPSFIAIPANSERVIIDAIRRGLQVLSENSDIQEVTMQKLFGLSEFDNSGNEIDSSYMYKIHVLEHHYYIEGINEFYGPAQTYINVDDLIENLNEKISMEPSKDDFLLLETSYNGEEDKKNYTVKP